MKFINHDISLSIYMLLLGGKKFLNSVGVLGFFDNKADGA